MDQDFRYTFAPNAVVIGAVYIVSLYAAFYIFSARNQTKKSDASLAVSSATAPTASDGDSPRSCATLSPEAKSEVKSNSERSIGASLSCLPFDGPQARAEAGMVVDRFSSNLIVHGGDGLLGDIHVFDCEKLKWNEFNLTPNDRRKFSMISAHDGTIIIFGGMDKRGTATNELSTIDITTKGFSWTDHQTSNQSDWPSARYGHGMCLIDEVSSAMYGGRDSAGNHLNDLWMLMHRDSTKARWKKLKPCSSNRPKPRAYPSIAYLNDKIYVFGETHKSRGEVDSFSLVTHKWEVEVTCGEEPTDQDCQVHSLDKAMKLVTVSNTESSSCGMFNRLDILDIQTKPMTWTKVDFSWYGDWTMIPGVRRLFCSAMDSGRGLLYVFGGVQANAQLTEGEEGAQDLLSTLIVVNFSRQTSMTKDFDGRMHTSIANVQR